MKDTFIKGWVIRKQFDEQDAGIPNLWGHFDDCVLGACHEVCGMSGQRGKGGTWCWNE